MTYRPLQKLYIPHGSDKTNEQPQATAIMFDFISHMVQIKLISRNPFLCNHILYIPHGSDKTCQWSKICVLLYSLYIPHGSDKTRYCNHCGI